MNPDIDNFMLKRPAAGKLFLCACDVITLFNIYAGMPLHPCETTERSKAILLSKCLIDSDCKLTQHGQNVVQTIINLPVGCTIP